MPEIKLEKFQGPLDLLLQLIDEEKLEITEISLSTITEQYLDYLSKIESEQGAEEMADFLVIATKLVYIKSKHLLPYLYPEEDEGPSLSDQLKMYKRFIEASLAVEKIWNGNQVAYGREESPRKLAEFTVPKNAGIDNLRQNFVDLLRRLKPINPLPQTKIDGHVSVQEIVSHFKETLRKLKQFSFSEILKNANSRTEVIVSFLAVLDLVRAGEAFVQQTNSFGDLEIKKT